MKVEIILPSAQKPVVAFHWLKGKTNSDVWYSRPNYIPHWTQFPLPGLPSTFLLPESAFLAISILELLPICKVHVHRTHCSLRSLLYVFLWGAIAPFSSPTFHSPCSQLSEVSMWTSALWWCCIDWSSCSLYSIQLPIWKTELLKLFFATTILPCPFYYFRLLPTPFIIFTGITNTGECW